MSRAKTDEPTNTKFGGRLVLDRMHIDHDENMTERYGHGGYAASCQITVFDRQPRVFCNPGARFTKYFTIYHTIIVSLS